MAFHIDSLCNLCYIVGEGILLSRPQLFTVRSTYQDAYGQKPDFNEAVGLSFCLPSVSNLFRP
jgi:hypothetical protein